MADNNGGFAAIIPFTMKWEGGLTDDAADSGGLTNFGVCAEFLKDCTRNHPAWLRAAGIPVTGGDRARIRALTRANAEELFRQAFWLPYGLDDLPVAVAACVFDMNMNHGAGNAIRIAQKACNLVLDGDPLLVDGKLGPKTRAALAELNSVEGIAALCGCRRDFYRRIVANRPSQKVFLRGWTNRADALQEFAEGLLR